MSVASRPVSTGKTRTCPHCKATILESLSICPGCMHHLRFDSEAAKRQVAAAPALRVEGIIRHPPLEQPLEYFVIIAIRNDRGEEVTRQVVNVGALQAAEKRTFTLSVEVLPPQAPVPTKSTSGTGTFKAPSQPAATVRPSAPPPASSASGGSPPPAGSAPASGSASASTAPASASSGSPQNPQDRRAPSANPAAGRTAVTGSPPAGSKLQAPGNPAAASNPTAAGNPTAPKAPTPTTTPSPSGSNPSASNPGGASSGSATSAKPASGYVLKPPSPGGPKRH